MAFVPMKIQSRSAPSINIEKMEMFCGVDMTNAPANVKKTRSPNAPNMIRETRGKVRKRTGWHTVKSYKGKINGVHFLVGEKNKKIVHAGNNIYLGDSILYSDAADTRSVSRQIGGRLWILDGKKYLVFDGETVSPVQDTDMTIPIIIISRSPSEGGGKTLDPVNLLQPKRTEQYLGTEGDKIYQLSAYPIDSTAVEVKKRNASGGWDVLSEGSDFTVDRKTGKVTFTTAPGVSPVVGEDNVSITYAKTIEGYADRINRCDISTLYGVNGARDRIFVAGNPELPNYDYYSELNDPTFFGDQWYSVLGQDSSKIMGYSIVGQYLAVHKYDAEDDTNIILRNGTLEQETEENRIKAAFPLAGSFQGTGAISKYAFSYLETEPLFLTENGINAVTPSDVLGERYSQSRSYYINEILTKEPNLSEAVAVTYDQFYMLSVNGKMYILDGTQYSSESNTPFSYRQYECFYWTNIPARVLYTENGKLCFGTEDGKLAEFYPDWESVLSYSDDGVKIDSWWDTPEFYGNHFYNKKNYSKIAVLLGSAVTTSCRVSAKVRGIWQIIKEYDVDARYFSFSSLIFSKIKFSADATPAVINEKIKINKVNKLQFRFENSVLNEPFSLYSAAAEFIENR